MGLNMPEIYRGRCLRRNIPGGAGGKESHLLRQETQEMWVHSPGLKDPLEKEMATHSSILASRIPPTEEPGWL